MSAAHPAYRFFFDPIDGRGFRVYAQFMAWWTAFYLVERIPHAEELYLRPVLRSPTWPVRFLDPPMPPEWVFQAFMACVVAASILYALAPRAAALRWLVVVGLSAIYSLDQVGARAYGALALVQWWLLVAVPHPTGLDQRARLDTGWPVRLLQLQFCAVYAFAAIAKVVEGTGWSDGSALFGALSSPRYGDYLLSTWLPADPTWLMPLGWLVIGLEAFIAVALWRPRLRPWAISGVVALHLGIALSLRVSWLFSALMIGHLLLFGSRGPNSNANDEPPKTAVV